MVSIVFLNPPLSLTLVINLLPSPKLFPPLFLFSHLPNPSLYNDEELFRSCYRLFEVAALQFDVQNMFTGKVSNFVFFYLPIKYDLGFWYFNWLDFDLGFIRQLQILQCFFLFIRSSITHMYILKAKGYTDFGNANTLFKFQRHLKVS